MELTPHDDLPFHQALTPFHVPATSDPHYQDGYYFALYRPGVHVFFGLRLHPNNNTMDAYAGIVTDGEQRNVRVSRALLPAHNDLTVGPLELRILVPMERQLVVIEDNPTGLRAEVEVHASTPPFVERSDPQYRFGRLFNHVLRYTLPTRNSGWIEFDGQREDVEQWHGCRDHSWGIRSTMGPYVPIGGIGSGFSDVDERALRLWVPFESEGLAGFFHTHEDHDRRTLDVEGRIHLADSESRGVTRVEHDLDYHEGSRRLRAGTLRLHDDAGEHHDLAFEVSCDPAHPQGFGYTRGWEDGGQPGVYRGGEDGFHLEHDRFPTADPAARSGPSHVPEGRRLGGTEFSTVIRSDRHGEGMAHVEHMLYGRRQ